ncbi:hypothetical protein FLB_26900 [Flavobacterium succinicans]|uniref:Uncharacterized protein n=1 Tax=Flavobacterium succinicans TaxID=29536 RepID=A0A199XP30_9FLAO|nr:hypothetical protein FLB_26900 [Flavobacterium succinicans]
MARRSRGFNLIGGVGGFKKYSSYSACKGFSHEFTDSTQISVNF